MTMEDTESQGQESPGAAPAEPANQADAGKKNRGSFAVSLGLIAMGGLWLAVLIAKGDQHFVRWLGSVVLIIVGVTGVFGIGRAKVKPR